MSLTQGSILFAAALASGLVIWFFFLRRAGVRLVTQSDVQEANIRVKGGYTPDILVLQAGRPVRLHFTREETASCSEMVLFPDFDKSARLPTGETVTVEFTPDHPGEFGFQCQMGMLRGKLIVE